MAGMAAGQSIRIPRPRMSRGGCWSGRRRTQPCACPETLGHAAGEGGQQSIVLVNRTSTALYSGMVCSDRWDLHPDQLAIDLRQSVTEPEGLRGSGNHRIDPQRNCSTLKGRPALISIGSARCRRERPNATGIPIALETSLAFLESEDPPTPGLTSDRAGAAVWKSLALRRRWPLRHLQLQHHPGQLDTTRKSSTGPHHPDRRRHPPVAPACSAPGARDPLAGKGWPPVNSDGRVRTDCCLRVSGHHPHAKRDAVIRTTAAGIRAWAVRGCPGHYLEAARQGRPCAPGGRAPWPADRQPQDAARAMGRLAAGAIASALAAQAAHRQRLLAGFQRPAAMADAVPMAAGVAPQVAGPTLAAALERVNSGQPEDAVASWP